MSNASIRAITDIRSNQASDESREMIHRLTALAVRGLVPMFDSERQLFCFSLTQSDSGLVRTGSSHRYTIMTLMGLHRLEQSGATSPIPIRPALDGLLNNLDWIGNIGDLGLLLWLCALAAPERLAEIERQTDIKATFARSRQVRQGRTMELAWFLAGLSHRKIACPDGMPCMKDLAFESYRMLAQNQGEQGVFGHFAGHGNLSDMFRRRIGNFADQVYPIYAMSKFSQAYGERCAVERALDCALKICEAQGPRGQWWWHYDSGSGRIAGRFPVYSVHQHAMAPMALLALGDAIQSDFTPWIYKGLQWIRDNELAFDMEDESANVVWRSQYRTTLRRWWGTAVALLTRREDPESRHGLKVLYECRPYELGWLLYAFANWNGR
jgi:hypothetical protein